MHIKWGGMLVALVRGVNFGFWSPLGCSEEKATCVLLYIAMKVLFRVSREEIEICIFNVHVLNMVFFWGQKVLGHTMIGLL